MTVQEHQTVLVRCILRRGPFPHERAFTIRFDDGSAYRGTVDEGYCFGDDRRPLGDAPPIESRSWVIGWIMGLLFARDEDGTARVQLPDGEVYRLDDYQFSVPVRTLNW